MLPRKTIPVYCQICLKNCWCNEDYKHNIREQDKVCDGFILETHKLSQKQLNNYIAFTNGRGWTNLVDLVFIEQFLDIKVYSNSTLLGGSGYVIEDEMSRK